MCGNNDIVETAPGVWECISDYIPNTRRACFYRARAVVKASGRRLDLCERCGAVGDMHLHHIDRNIKNWTSTNIEVLCIACHKAEHPERLKFKYDGVD